MKKHKISSGDMSALVNSKITNVEEQVNKFTTPTNTTTLDSGVVTKAVAVQEENIQQAISENGTVRRLNTPVDRQARTAAKIKDAIIVNLDKYINPRTGSSERIQALAKIVDGIIKQPTKEVLDNVLAFFVSHRDDEQLQENNALKNITELDITVHHKVRLFYAVMMELARGTATKKTISIEIIRNIFKNDDFPNWVAVKIAKKR
jgi:hypothetical protein